MSLRMVHTLFIALAAVLALTTGVWLAVRAQRESTTVFATAALCCGIASCGLLVYAARFVSRSRQW